MISCVKHTILRCKFRRRAQPPGAANDVHAEIEGCHCEPVVLRAANQNLNDCQWQSYLSVAHAGVAPSGDSLRSQSVPLGSHSGGSVTKWLRGQIEPSPPLPGHLSHRERQVPASTRCGERLLFRCGLAHDDPVFWHRKTPGSDCFRAG